MPTTNQPYEHIQRNRNAGDAAQMEKQQSRAPQKEKSGAMREGGSHNMGVEDDPSRRPPTEYAADDDMEDEVDLDEEDDQDEDDRDDEDSDDE